MEWVVLNTVGPILIGLVVFFGIREQKIIVENIKPSLKKLDRPKSKFTGH